MTRDRILDMLAMTGLQGRDLDRALWAAQDTSDAAERARALSSAQVNGRELYFALGRFLLELEAEAKAAAAQMQAA